MPNTDHRSPPAVGPRGLSLFTVRRVCVLILPPSLPVFTINFFRLDRLAVATCCPLSLVKAVHLGLILCNVGVCCRSLITTPDSPPMVVFLCCL